MKENAYKKADFQNADHHGSSHEMSGFVKHFTAIICPDTGINPNMYYKKRNKKQSCQTHYQFFANRRSQEFRPFHPLFFILFFRMERPINFLPGVKFVRGRFIYTF
jgi:hypothetical protein